MTGRCTKVADGTSDGPHSSTQLWLAIAYFTVTSGTLLVINKVAVVALPAPTFLLLSQVLFSTTAISIARFSGVLTLTKASTDQLLRFLPVVVAFLGTIYANMKVLQHSTVETFITFRSSTPIVLSFCDFVFLGRQLPSGRSWCALGLLLLSSAGYTYFDQGFVANAYVWLLVWYMFFTFEGVWVKHMCDTVPMSTWTRVYYSNTLSSPLLALILFVSKEEQRLLAKSKWMLSSTAPLMLSCLVGLAMSHSSYLLRSHASATTAAVVGVVCKLLSVSLNLLIWDQHANGMQLAFLLIGLFAASTYQQAPLRVAKTVEG